MKIKNLKFKISILICLFAYLIIFPFNTNAQAKPPQGITVIPSIQNVDLATDPPQYQLTYINGTNSPIDLSLSTQDFTQLEDGYKLSFLEGKDAANYKYSLSSWITFENKNLHLDPGETKSITVFIDSNRITRGGHYASILAEVKQPDNKKQIDIKAIISSLLFVRANTGNEIESGKIVSVKPVRDGLDFPNDFNLRFQNDGNVYVIPYGILKVTGPLGNEVAKGILNQDSLNALPESIRKYSVQTNSSSKILLPGIYKAHIDMHFGKSNQKINQDKKFFSWGSFNFIKVGVIILILALIIFFVRSRFVNK